MFNRLTIAQRLSALVVALLAIPILIGLFGQHAQQGILDDFATTYNDRVVCLKQLKIVADSYAVGIVDGAHKLQAGSINADSFGGLASSQAALKKQWSDYRATYLTAEEKPWPTRPKRRCVTPTPAWPGSRPWPSPATAPRCNTSWTRKCIRRSTPSPPASPR